MTDTVQVVNPTAQPPLHERNRRKRTRWTFVVLVLLVILMASAFGAFCIFTHSSAANAYRFIEFGAGYLKGKIVDVPPFHGKKHVNILMLGADVSFDGSGIARTDTIKVVSVDLEKSHIAVLSIPRDTWVEIPDHGHGRINSAYQFGGKKELDRIHMAESVISQFLGDLSGREIHFDRYVRLQTGGFVKIIDAIGGVDIDVEKQMDYEDPSQELYIHLKPGMQHLDGMQAMGYIRFRHDAEGDYGRIRRQDQLMSVLQEQMHQPEMKARIPSLIGPIMSAMITNLTVHDVQGLKKLADKIGNAGITKLEIPTVPTTKGLASVVEVQDPEAASQVIGELLDGPRPTVTVLNGSPHTGLAREVRDAIDVKTFNVVETGTTAQPAQASRIYCAPEHVADAQALATQFGITAAVETRLPPPPEKAGSPTVTALGKPAKARHDAKKSAAPKDETAIAAEITLVIGPDFPEVAGNARPAQSP